MFKTYWLKPFIKQPPTKTFRLSDGKIESDDYPFMKNYKGIIQETDSLRDFYEVLTSLVSFDVFMIHGEFIQGIDTNNMIRRSREKDGIKPTICNSMLNIFVIDIDDYKLVIHEGDLIERGKDSIELFIEENLPEEFQKVDYIYQFSSSFGIKNKDTLKAHLFFTPTEPIHNEALRKWAKSWNEAHGARIIDPAVYRAVQPIYTRLRVCEGFDDPIDPEDMIGYVNKGNMILDWQPTTLEKKTEEGETKFVSLKKNASNDYDLSRSIRNIMSAENFHEEIRSTALSLINKKVSPKDTKLIIKEFMHIAKQSILENTDRMEAWQERYDDIDRAIESAVEIVDIPSYDDIAIWLATSSKKEIQKGFAKKLVPFVGVELKSLTRLVDSKLGFGPRAISEDVKMAKAEQQEELAEIARNLKSEERKARNIHEIEITNSTYGVATRSICRVLANSNKTPEVYKLGNSLSVVDFSMPKTIRQVIKKNKLDNDYPKMLIVNNIESPVGAIRERVEKDCVFFNEQKKEMVCPESILNAVPSITGVDWKPLTGIVEHPFIDDEWKLIEQNGYDPNTGLYSYLHHKLKIELIDPEDAYSYMANEVLYQFPFQTELDLVATIAMFMTAIQRPYVMGDNGMPGFAIVSPKPSSGKTTLAQLLSYSIYNRPVAATGWSDNDEELGKHLLAILREGHSCVLFDNIKKDAAIKSNELAKAMTAGTYSRRKLGANETEEVPSSALWLFTGNNIVFKGDFATRIIPIRIVPDMEHPQFRTFKRGDIGKWAMENRKKIISAVLSMVLLGKEFKDTSYDKSSRFKDWDRFVRIPLMEITGHDILDMFERNDFLDDETIAKGNLLELFHSTFSDKKFITKDIINLASGNRVDGANTPLDSNGSEFVHAITDAFNEKATTNIKTLGRYILGMKDFIINGYQLIREDKAPTVKWRVIKIEE